MQEAPDGCDEAGKGGEQVGEDRGDEGTRGEGCVEGREGPGEEHVGRGCRAYSDSVHYGETEGKGGECMRSEWTGAGVWSGQMSEGDQTRRARGRVLGVSDSGRVACGGGWYDFPGMRFIRMTACGFRSGGRLRFRRRCEIATG